MENNTKVHFCHLMKDVNVILLRIILVVVLFFGGYASLNAADNPKTKINLQLENVTIKVILSSIEKTTDFIFIYNEGIINSNSKKSISVKDETIENVLANLFRGLDVIFKIDGRQVYITKRQKQMEEKPKSELKKNKITGQIVDEKKDGVIGASVMINGTSIGTVSDINGYFSIEVPENTKLRISYVGYEHQLVNTDGKTVLNIALVQTPKNLEEVVVVGYGSQKKQSVVGSIVQTKGSDLERTGVSTSVASALTGLMPGISTTTVSGMPGAPDPKITIRGVSSWNGSDPLVLIDGVERKLSDIDMGQIDAISVLKDASATAVFGVKGAEGVILVTTKRGKEGKAQISFSTNTDFKFISRLPQKMDSYDTFVYQDEVIERQNAANPSIWSWYLPKQLVNKYRYPSTPEESYLYPNVNWADEVTKPTAMIQRYDLNISGGTTFTKYFAALSYLKDDDIINSGLDIGFPYKAKWGFKRYNFRSNLDFNLTKSTVFSVNLAGSLSQKDGFSNALPIWNAFYQLSPSTFPVRYPDGVFGFNLNKTTDANPMKVLSGASGLTTDYTTQLSSDFKLKQDLSFITQGLSAQLSLSYDNRLYSGSSINQIDLLAKSIDRDGTVTYSPPSGSADYDFFSKPGTIGSESFNVGSTQDRLYYQGQVNYVHTFGKHDVTALALMSREQYSNGSEFPHFREDWVGRFTYGFDDRYFIEANGAYNGSERFASKYRFGFFPSLGLGWMLSNESFIKQSWLDKLKVRYSIGTVGSDNFTSPRWSYNTQWGLDGGDISTFGTSYTTGAINSGIVGANYLQYKEMVIGNPDLQWEVSQKQNIGLDFSVLNGIFSGTVDVFRDDRSNVFMSATQRSSNIFSYFGAAPVAANIGKVLNQGFEIDLKLQQTWAGIHCWLGYSIAHSKEKIIFAEDPQLRPTYQKSMGFPIGQTRRLIEQPGFNTSWDDLYGSVPYETNSGRLPGDLAVIDFNSDGVVNLNDAFRYGYNSRPENTYNISTGIDYKGFSFMIQFFGVNNVSQDYTSLYTFVADERAPRANILLSDYWTPNNPDAVFAISRAGGSGYGLTSNYRNKILDGSYLRLKNLDVSYTFKGKWIKSLNMSSLKTSISGNNLLFWSKMPDDKEAAINIYTQSSDLYPTVRLVKFAINVTF